MIVIRSGYLLRLISFVAISSISMNARHAPYTIRIVSFELP